MGKSLYSGEDSGPKRERVIGNDFSTRGGGYRGGGSLHVKGERGKA